VIEIGAGVGTITDALAGLARRVIAIERDRDLVAVLRNEFASASNVEIAEENALTFDYSATSDLPVKVVGNLPYNISSPLLFHLMTHRHSVGQATLMFQRELADRIVAGPGTRAYGIPSVICQQFADVRRCFTVSAGAFVPKPRVDSAVVLLVMREMPRSPCEDTLFQEVVRAAFRVRRKMVRNALTSRFGPDRVGQALAAAGLEGSRRAETLTVEEYGHLTAALAAGGAGPRCGDLTR